MANPIIQARAVEKFYVQPDGNRIEVIAPTDLDVSPGQIVALLGPSGSGKSTLLRMLTGLSQPSSGDVLWHGESIRNHAPNVAIVFQSFALFPWLNVLENVEAPLEARGVSAIERRKRALKMLDTVGLDRVRNRVSQGTLRRHETACGFRSRAGRGTGSPVHGESFSALDVLTAENLRGELLELWLSKKMPASAIFVVTHNIEEAVLLADRVIVLGRNPGRIRSDFELELPQPRDRKAARFVEFVDYIYKIMTQPEVEHAPLPCGQAPVAPIRTPRQKYQMLPHARPGGIAGLLELLHDQGGRDDIYRLAEPLAMDVDDLLPIIEAATMLGFAALKEGDVEVTGEAAGPDCRFRSRDGAVSRDLAGPDPSGRRARHWFHCPSAAGHAVVHPVQRDCRSHSDPHRFKGSLFGFWTEGMGALAQTDSARNFSLPSHRPSYRFGRRLERQHSCRVRSLQGTNLFHHWTRSRD